MIYTTEVQHMCPVAKGHYGQFDNAAKYIDPRQE